MAFAVLQCSAAVRVLRDRTGDAPVEADRWERSFLPGTDSLLLIHRSPVQTLLRALRRLGLVDGEASDACGAGVDGDDEGHDRASATRDLGLGVGGVRAPGDGGAFTWDEIANYRDRWKRPLVVKGILHPADAEKCVALGVDGIFTDFPDRCTTSAS